MTGVENHSIVVHRLYLDPLCKFIDGKKYVSVTNRGHFEGLECVQPAAGKVQGWQNDTQLGSGCATA
jgi:hypothetical protein